MSRRWDVSIRQMANGWVMQGTNWEGGRYEEVFEAADGDNVEAFQRLLYAITEQFGMVGSKYDERRIRIVIEPGESYDGKQGGNE